MIDEIRKEIDKLDAELVGVLSKRMELSHQLGLEKLKMGVEVHQKTREIAVLDRVKLLSDSLGLSDTFITDVYSVIFAESRRLQNKHQES